MITVQININGNCIMARSATRIKEPDFTGYAIYKTDCGKLIRHNPEKGAIKLSKKMLDYIQEKT